MVSWVVNNLFNFASNATAVTAEMSYLIDNVTAAAAESLSGYSYLYIGGAVLGAGYWGYKYFDRKNDMTLAKSLLPDNLKEEDKVRALLRNSG
ncbi:MAG TPA: hypothetical protein DCE71_06770, partial [Parachlamydiales bacterium]|nr:hypothetical protein [Parachlamydiales bacterium]